MSQVPDVQQRGGEAVRGCADDAGGAAGVYGTAGAGPQPGSPAGQVGPPPRRDGRAAGWGSVGSWVYMWVLYEGARKRDALLLEIFNIKKVYRVKSLICNKFAKNNGKTFAL